ncbi:MAG: CatB-related O-acetyltransferase [Ignavibacteria bacterium]|nr:CatB-related O-acetyltransferase [Ignavibacteria bacterium]
MLLKIIKHIIRPFISPLLSNIKVVKYLLRYPTLKIGNNVIISKSIFGRYNSIGSNTTLFKTHIGDFSYISHNSSINNTTIGKYCSIAHNVTIGTASHPTKEFVSTHPIFFSTLKQCGITYVNQDFYKEFNDKITIGNDVWIGMNTIIIKEVNIGDGAIIAAGSIITKDVQPYTIVAGIPGKVIKERFTHDQKQFLLSDKWWNKDEYWIKNNYTLFQDITQYIKANNEDPI